MLTSLDTRLKPLIDEPSEMIEKVREVLAALLQRKRNDHRRPHREKVFHFRALPYPGSRWWSSSRTTKADYHYMRAIIDGLKNQLL